MPKKPRMPKNVPSPQQQPEPTELEDDAIITDDPAPVTKITRRKSTQEQPGKHQAKPVVPDEPPAPAPRSKIRERLWAGAKPAAKKPQKRSTKKIASDIWERAERATSFENEPEPARQFSGRTVALLTVLFIAALIMAQPLQLLLEQQNDITQAQQQLAQEQQLEEELTTQLERWEDPAYVQQQARERFSMVMPGERRYLVIDDETDTTESEPNVATIDEDLEMGWADRLWGSVLTSGQG
ncbi:MAG TPA: septum formation initiator family protein [Enteractinococcus sp.]